MSKVLTTFSGRFGDILWSLATVREISRLHNCKVDFMCMPQYKSLLLLLQDQTYIDKAFVDETWVCTGSPHADQPWYPDHGGELDWQYEKVYHLTYRYHPGIRGYNGALIDFTAFQQGITLTEPVVPFIDLSTKPIIDEVGVTKPYIAYAFNSDYADHKQRFLEVLKTLLPDITFVNTMDLSWQSAATTIHTAMCFVGCRSSNYVLAHGVGQKNIFVYEPHPARHSQGQFPLTFGNPHWKEETQPLEMSPVLAAEGAVTQIKIWKEQENKVCQEC